MEISEIIKNLREETGLSRKEFAEQLGIPLRTIEDWEAARRKPPEYIPRLIAYQVRLELLKKRTVCQRTVNVIKDANGHNIVMINDIRFKGKRAVNWDDVKEYLKQYVGDFYTMADSQDVVFIGSDLPDEFTGSKYTNSLKGANAKAKANAAQGIPELIESAIGRHFRENQNEKHIRDAKYGWYRYDSRFALPVYAENGEVERYNVFHASMLIRHAADGKLYLYDIIDIKKETSNSLSK